MCATLAGKLSGRGRPWINKSPLDRQVVAGKFFNHDILNFPPSKNRFISHRLEQTFSAYYLFQTDYDLIFTMWISRHRVTQSLTRANRQQCVLILEREEETRESSLMPWRATIKHERHGAILCLYRPAKGSPISAWHYPIYREFSVDTSRDNRCNNSWIITALLNAGPIMHELNSLQFNIHSRKTIVSFWYVRHVRQGQISIWFCREK